MKSTLAFRTKNAVLRREKYIKCTKHFSAEIPVLIWRRTQTEKTRLTKGSQISKTIVDADYLHSFPVKSLTSSNLLCHSTPLVSTVH